MKKTDVNGKVQPASAYEPPRIEHKGALKQFAGSPLGKKPDGTNPLGLP